jgi:hypothetical protein
MSLESMTFPTEKQRAISERVVSRLAADPEVEAVALTASLALGYGDPVSDLDMVVYARPPNLEAVRERCLEINERYDRDEDFWVDIEVSSGDFAPGVMGWCEVDEFELEVGNFVAHAVPVFDRNGMFAELQGQWLPYYDEELARMREKRWARLTTNHCVQGMKSVRRDFALDALDRLHMGVRSFVAAMFVARRVYPVDYLKRVDRHLRVLLGEPELGAELRSLFDFGPLEPLRVEQSFRRLDALARTRLGADGPSAF